MLLVHVERVNQEVGKYGLPRGSVRFRRHAAVLTSSERAAAKPEVRFATGGAFATSRTSRRC